VKCCMWGHLLLRRGKWGEHFSQTVSHNQYPWLFISFIASIFPHYKLLTFLKVWETSIIRRITKHFTSYKITDREAIYVLRSIEVRSRNRCFRGKTISITCFQWMFIASVFHAPYCTVICGLSSCTAFFHIS
jgi:hypothetical protein